MEDWVVGLIALAVSTAVMYWLLYSPRKPLQTAAMGASAILGYGLLTAAFIGATYLLFRLASLLL